MSGEVWVNIFGYEGRYQISSLGRVRALAWTEKYRRRDGKLISRQRREYIMKPAYHPHRGGYFEIMLRSRPKKPKNYYIHRLVAEHFLPIPADKTNMQVNHMDCDKSNNAVSNLEWITREQNVRHAFVRGRYKRWDLIDA